MAQIRYEVRRKLLRGLTGAAVAAALLSAMAPIAGASGNDDHGSGGSGSGSSGGVLSGTLYYDEFSQYSSAGTNPQDDVRSVSYTYDGSSFTLGATSGIAQTAGADGIAWSPDGNLLIGGQNTGDVFEVNPTSDAVTTAALSGPNPNAFLITPDPSGQVAWTAGLPGPLFEVPLNPFGGTGTEVTLTGDDPYISGIAFTPSGQAFYTASGPGGMGDFGTINLTTLTTHRVFSGIDAHGITYDAFTGDLLTVGGSEITQIDPSTLAVVSQTGFTLPGTGYYDTLDQVSVDGAGHAFIAVNDGTLIFVDYSKTGSIGDSSNFVSSQFLDNALDGVLATPSASTSCTRDPDSNGDLNSNNHNGHGEDVGSDSHGNQKCDPDSNGDLNSNNHNGQGKG